MAKGWFEKGKIKPTKNQVKKYDLSLEEKNYLFQELTRARKTYGNLKYISHVFQKMHNGLSFDKKEIIRMIRSQKDFNHCVINYAEQNRFGQTIRRVLLRSNAVQMVEIDGVPTLCHLCAVIDIDRNVLVTVYYNDVNDHHESLDPTRDTKNIEIIR